MIIKRLSIENFRTIENERFEPGGGLNLFYGDNAMGKTTVLEAISVLSSSRSFRSTKNSELVRYESEGFRLHGMVKDRTEREMALGIERIKGEISLRAEGMKANKVSDLARRLPVQVIHPDSHLIIGGGPKQRRRYLDWGVFHVEPDFLEQWKRYEKALRQRNAALKKGLNWRSISVWDSVLSDSAGRIHGYRLDYVNRLRETLPRFTREIASTGHFEIAYLPGWDVQKSLGEELMEKRKRDLGRGFTCSGPHRADLEFRVDGKHADSHVSRGQQKMLVFALLLSQVIMYRGHTGENCVLLLDDLAAELDTSHQARIMKILRALEVQTFVTSVRKESLEYHQWSPCKLFHVEHGKIREVV